MVIQPPIPMKNFLRHIFFSSLFIIGNPGFFATAAQVSPYYSITYADSLCKTAKSEFIYNNLIIANTFNKILTVEISITTPEGWRLLANQQTTFDLPPGDSYILPLTFSSLPTASATWSPVTVTVHLKNAPQNDDYYFFIKNKAKTDYLATMHNNVTELGESYQPQAELQLYLKNKGNMRQIYYVKMQNKFLDLDKTKTIVLPAGADTIWHDNVQISRTAWNNLKEERIKIRISNDSGKVYCYDHVIKKIASTSRQHASSFITVPLEVRAGVFSSGNQTSYSAGIQGAIKINDNSSLAFYYATSQLGSGDLNRNAFSLLYNYKSLQVALGDVAPETRQFQANGYGAKISNKWPNGVTAALYAIKHYSTSIYANDMVGARFGFSVKKVGIDQNIVGVADSARHLNSFLYSNAADLINKNGLLLKVKTGLGFEHYTLVPSSAPNDVIAGSLAYTFALDKKRVSLYSSIIQNGDNLPGMYKGYRQQDHKLDYKNGNSFAGIFYQLNYIKTDYLKDSIYLNNVLLANSEYYGFHVGSGWDRFSVSAGAGMFDELVHSANTLNSMNPKYQAVNLDLGYSGKKVSLQMSGLACFTNLWAGTANTDTLSLLSGRLLVNAPFGGMQAYYVHQLNVGDSKDRYSEVQSYSVFAAHAFFHNQLIARLQYNLNRNNRSGDVSNVTGSVSYNSPKNGLSIFCLGMAPLGNGSAGTASFNLTVSKKFNAPVVFLKKKYYDLDLTLYYDVNSNGMRDAEDSLLAGTRVSIDDLELISDKGGHIKYDNLEKGSYKLDMQHAVGHMALIPVDGPVQSVSMDASKHLDIPFKRAKFIRGTVGFVLDTSMHTPISYSDIKIIVTDTNGGIYSAMTDDKGQFRVNIPSAVYKVSLNPDAFDETMYPEQLAYSVDLRDKEYAEVGFTIVQKKREVHIISLDGDATVITAKDLKAATPNGIVRRQTARSASPIIRVGKVPAMQSLKESISDKRRSSAGALDYDLDMHYDTHGGQYQRLIFFPGGCMLHSPKVR